MTNLDEMRHQLDLLNDEELLTILREHDDEEIWLYQCGVCGYKWSGSRS
jgi:rubrerythrin